MRHQRKTVKLQRRADHRRAMLANLLCSLIIHKRIRTTLAKAKAVRPMADKLVTLGKRGDLHARRIAIAKIRNKDAVKELFASIAPAAAGRQGGYTRIIKLGPRPSDSAPMALIEWVDQPVIAAGTFEEAPAKAEAAAPAKDSPAKAELESPPAETVAETESTPTEQAAETAPSEDSQKA